VIVNIASGATTGSYGVAFRRSRRVRCSIHLRNVTARLAVRGAGAQLRCHQGELTNGRGAILARLWEGHEQPNSDWELIDDGSFNGAQEIHPRTDEDEGTVQVRYEQDTTDYARRQQAGSGRKRRNPHGRRA
jgi:hypothetical protein